MKPITSRVKESCSPLKQTTNKKGSGQVAIDGKLYDAESDLSLKGNTGKGYVPPTFTPEGNAAYEAKTQAERDAQDAAYIKNNPLPGGSEVEGEHKYSPELT